MAKVKGTLNAEYNGFHYGEVNNRFIIQTPEKKAPNTVFRYMSLNNYSINGIINHQVWASQPDTFNDIFDSNLDIINVENVTWDDIKTFFEPDPDAESKFKENPKKFLHDFRWIFYRFMINKMGVLCTTRNYDHELFWGYYNNHEGVCVEYDHTQFPNSFSYPLPINYLKPGEFKTIDFHTFKGPGTFQLMTNIKKDIWEQEDEFRFIIKAPGDFVTTGRFGNDDNPYSRSSRIVDIPSQCLKSVTLGLRFFNEGLIIYPNGNTFVISMVSPAADLKIRLFDFIVKESIDLYGMDYHPETFEFRRLKYDISKIEEGRYSITRILPES